MEAAITPVSDPNQFSTSTKVPVTNQTFTGFGPPRQSDVHGWKAAGGTMWWNDLGIASDTRIGCVRVGHCQRHAPGAGVLGDSLHNQALWAPSCD